MNQPKASEVYCQIISKWSDKSLLFLYCFSDDANPLWIPARAELTRRELLSRADEIFFVLQRKFNAMVKEGKK